MPIFGRTLNDQDVVPQSEDDGVVAVHLEIDALEDGKLLFSPKEARDLATGLNWAADDAERAAKNVEG